MFIVKTYVTTSEIHGLGCFADEDLSEGQAIWEFAEGLDLIVPLDLIRTAPQAFQDFMDMYAYRSPQIAKGMVLSCDHAKFINHSDSPNTRICGKTTFAESAIKRGEEITCDYRICVADWSGTF